ncbi:MAG: GNAT family N-acetyltransferase, partial [Methylocella sp.]
MLKRFRSSPRAFDLVRSAIAHGRRKDFRRFYGHARSGLESFWARFGALPRGSGRTLSFSGYAYTEM